MMKPEEAPYCRACGYSLIGLTESSKCPECGRPIVDVLVRDSFPGKTRRRYQSARRWLGLPLISIAVGPHGSETLGRPVGVIAIGDAAKGIIAIGGRAVGVIAIGGAAVGVLSLGGVAVGLGALGGCAVGVIALGGFAAGGYAIGGTAVAVLGGFGARVFRLWP